MNHEMHEDREMVLIRVAVFEHHLPCETRLDLCGANGAMAASVPLLIDIAAYTRTRAGTTNVRVADGAWISKRCAGDVRVISAFRG